MHFFLIFENNILNLNVYKMVYDLLRFIKYKLITQTH